MVVLLNIIPFLGWGAAVTALLWPLLGVSSLLVALPIFAYPVAAWFWADTILARQAEFRPPTGLQSKYFEFLGITERVWTHPSLIVAAGVVAGPKERTILLTAGLTRYLNDQEIKSLVKQLAARPHPAVFSWTYHLATSGALMFSATPKRDFSSEWLRLMLVSAVVVASLTGALLIIFINALSGALPLWLAVAALLVPFFVLVAWVGWSTGATFLSKVTAQKWNHAIWVSAIRLRPMERPKDGYHRLHLLYAGLVEGHDIPEIRQPDPIARENGLGHVLAREEETRG